MAKLRQSYSKHTAESLTFNFCAVCTCCCGYCKFF